jgi:regulation of enolase protein 1 (concanavalin A-like superfamily)
VGAVGLAGSASYSAGTFTVKGAGADIWGTSDAFHFVHQPLAGDGRIVARVASLQNTHTYAKAGIMIRQSLAANSAHVILDVRPNGVIEFMRRSSTGATTTASSGGTQPAPVWLELRRSGATITAARSTDGTTWTTIGSTTITLTGTVQVGLVVCSHTTTLLNTATFTNVTVGGI